MKLTKQFTVLILAAAMALTLLPGKTAFAETASSGTTAAAAETGTTSAADTTITENTTSENTTDTTADLTAELEADNETAKTEVKAEETTVKVEKKEVSYTKAELRLLSSILYSEAGNEPYKGKLATASVIMNRVNSDQFPNSVKGVVYARGQFSPTWNGSLAKSLYLYDHARFTSAYQKDCIKVAKLALSGEIYMEGYYYFMEYSWSVAHNHPNGKRIGNQWYFKTW